MPIMKVSNICFAESHSLEENYVVTLRFVIIKAWRLYLLSNLDVEQHVEQKIYCCIGMIMSITIISKYDTNGSLFFMSILSSYTGTNVVQNGENER